jgi:DNA-binding LytR/AlgR family response regulator
VRSGDRIRFLPVKEIYFFKAEDKYVVAHTFEETFVLDQTLQQLETELPPDDFVRIHRSAIVNMNHVAEVVRSLSGNYRARLRNKQKTELPVSRQARARLIP